MTRFGFEEDSTLSQTEGSSGIMTLDTIISTYLEDDEMQDGVALEPSGSRINAEPEAVLNSIEECAVCGLEQAETIFPEEPPTEGCSHSPEVCFECLQQVINVAVTDSDCSSGIPCPTEGCDQRMEYFDVKKWAAPDTFDRYDLILLQSNLRTDQRYIWCMNTSCQAGQEHTGGVDSYIVICYACGSKQCFKHQILWHEDFTCDQWDVHVRDLSLNQDLTQQWIERETNRCPGENCGRPISKVDGCDHLICKKPGGCGHQFCWQCLAPWSQIIANDNSYHYDTCRYYTGLPGANLAPARIIALMGSMPNSAPRIDPPAGLPTFAELLRRAQALPNTDAPPPYIARANARRGLRDLRYRPHQVDGQAPPLNFRESILRQRQEPERRPSNDNIPFWRRLEPAEEANRTTGDALGTTPTPPRSLLLPRRLDETTPQPSTSTTHLASRSIDQPRPSRLPNAGPFAFTGTRDRSFFERRNGIYVDDSPLFNDAPTLAEEQTIAEARRLANEGQAALRSNLTRPFAFTHMQGQRRPQEEERLDVPSSGIQAEPSTSEQSARTRARQMLLDRLNGLQNNASQEPSSSRHVPSNPHTNRNLNQALNRLQVESARTAAPSEAYNSPTLNQIQVDPFSASAGPSRWRLDSNSLLQQGSLQTGSTQQSSRAPISLAGPSSSRTPRPLFSTRNIPLVPEDVTMEEAVGPQSIYQNRGRATFSPLLTAGLPSLMNARTTVEEATQPSSIYSIRPFLPSDRFTRNTVERGQPGLRYTAGPSNALGRDAETSLGYLQQAVDAIRPPDIPASPRGPLF